MDVKIIGDLGFGRINSHDSYSLLTPLWTDNITNRGSYEQIERVQFTGTIIGKRQCLPLREFIS